MSSSYDAGYYADQAYKARQKKCPKRKRGKHDYESDGRYPSATLTCKYCGDRQYTK